MNDKQLQGSNTAKNGFKNEDDIVDKFNNWKSDEDAQKWLVIMEYKIDEIESVIAVKLHGYKADVQVQITIVLKNLIDAQNIQVKLVSNSKGFNQIDKRWVDRYVEMWNIPNNIVSVFKRYTGENSPTIANTKDKRRMFLNEFDEIERSEFMNWLNHNKSLIVSDIIKGRGHFAAEWMLVAQKTNNNSRWILKPINVCLNYFGNGDILITERGNIKIGNITMQRKGGDNGRPTANMLQFKINPAELFEI